ncbi:MAG: tetratricopeptide repeat protein [Bacteroidales bacterium]|nr:tetratricopeptide repeat protein [Bacteroidales bacterium]
MEISKIKNLHQLIANNLSQKELKTALERLYEFNEVYPSWQIKDEIQSKEQSYKYMLKYMLDGIKDPDRDKFYNKLLLQCFKLNDILADSLLVKEDPSLYYSKKRSLLSQKNSFQDTIDRFNDICSKISLTKLLPVIDVEKKTALERDAELAASDIFYDIWVKFPLKNTDIELLHLLFNDTTVPKYFELLFISALTLNLIRNFDESALSILIDKAVSSESKVRERALVGIVFVALLNRNQFLISNDTKNRISILVENDEVKRLLKKIQLQLIKSKETERITKKMNEDIFPEMMKLSSKIGNNLDPNELINDLKENELNPEWEEYLKESGISDKLKEINNLQMEGSDVMMGTFSNLKAFPFFFNMSNWFLPFFKENSAVYSIDVNPDSQLIKSIESSRYLCDSDKYSFLLSLSQIPAHQRDSLSSQIISQNEVLEELAADEKSTNPELESESISNKYIQDLYRFYKLFSRKNEFKDPFDGDINFLSIEHFSDLFKEKRDIMLVAELNFRKEFYESALVCYDKILLLDSSDYEVYQKTGFCYQQLHNFEKAIDAYLNADIIHPDSLWTLKKIASCFRSLKKPEKALKYYLRALQISPDNKSLEMLAGHCYLEMKDYEKALNHYYKVDYLEPNNTRSWRAVAWCSFLLKKFEQSKRYYQKILSSKPDYSDYMNAAHTELLIGNIREALDYYKVSLNKLEGNISKFDECFNQDIQSLVDAGIKKEQIPLIKDQLLYSL